MQRCPNCRASYAEGAQCRRCGMDMSTLLAAEAAADTQLREALKHLTNDDMSAAISALQRAYALQRTPLTELLLGFAGNQYASLSAGSNSFDQPC